MFDEIIAITHLKGVETLCKTDRKKNIEMGLIKAVQSNSRHIYYVREEKSQNVSTVVELTLKDDGLIRQRDVYGINSGGIKVLSLCREVQQQ